MTWTYSGDPASDELNEYRFLIRDTDAIAPILQDEEVQYILDSSVDKTTRLYLLFEAAAATFARDIKKSLGPQSEDPTSRASYYATKANYYKKLMTMAHGLSIPKGEAVFTKGMHDNV